MQCKCMHTLDLSAAVYQYSIGTFAISLLFTTCPNYLQRFFFESTSYVRDLASRIARTPKPLGKPLLPETGYLRVPKPVGKPRFALGKVFIERCTQQIAPSKKTNMVIGLFAECFISDVRQTKCHDSKCDSDEVFVECLDMTLGKVD